MLFAYVKLVIILFLIGVSFKLISNVILFKSRNYNILNVKRSAILSLLIVVINLFFIIFQLLILQKYLLNSSKTLIIIFQSIGYFIRLSLVLLTIIFTKEGLYSIGITKKNIGSSIIIGIFLGIIFFIIIGKIFLVQKNMQPISIESLVNFTSIFIDAFVEEIIYRGYLQTRLIKYLGSIKGWLITSIIFMLFHLPNRIILSGVNYDSLLLNLFMLFIMGLLLGYIQMKIKNVLAGSIIHTFINWSQVILTIVG